MLKPFKVGDRVRCYQGTKHFDGIVNRVWAIGYLDVAHGPNSSISVLHPKQCRRLVLKPKRKLWTVIGKADNKIRGTYETEAEARHHWVNSLKHGLSELVVFVESKKIGGTE